MKIRFGTGAVRASTLAADCGGLWYPADMPDPLICGLCTDSAEADPETAFVALRGKRADGHGFIPEALANGAPCVICETSGSTPAIRVASCEAALLRLAGHVRKGNCSHAVAVTGSVGKTTTKDLIAQVLSREKPTFRTPGNHNSLIGMPLSMLEMPAGTEWAVLEMGMNAPGEIRRLSLAAAPEIALITNVGTAHIGAFGSRERIFAAKTEVFAGLCPNGLFLKNADDDLLSSVSGKNFRTLSLSRKGRKADFSAKNIRVEPDRTFFDLEWNGGVETDLCLRVAGAHNVSAALFAFAVGITAGVSPDGIREGLFSYQTDELRQQRTELSGVTLIEDCYNASYESVCAALDLLDALCADGRRRAVAVLGEMRELGSKSISLHRAIGERVARSCVKLLFTLGKEGSEIAAGAREAGKFAGRICENRDLDDLSQPIRALCREIRPGDVVLIKASRAVAAERVGSALKNFLRKEEGRDHA